MVWTCVLRKLGQFSPKLAIFPWPTSYSPLKVQLLESSLVEFFQLDPKKALKPLLAPQKMSLQNPNHKKKTIPVNRPAHCASSYIHRGAIYDYKLIFYARFPFCATFLSSAFFIIRSGLPSCWSSTMEIVYAMCFIWGKRFFHIDEHKWGHTNDKPLQRNYHLLDH